MRNLMKITMLLLLGVALTFSAAPVRAQVEDDGGVLEAIQAEQQAADEACNANCFASTCKGMPKDPRKICKAGCIFTCRGGSQGGVCAEGAHAEYPDKSASSASAWERFDGSQGSIVTSAGITTKGKVRIMRDWVNTPLVQTDVSFDLVDNPEEADLAELIILSNQENFMVKMTDGTYIRQDGANILDAVALVGQSVGADFSLAGYVDGKGIERIDYRKARTLLKQDNYYAQVAMLITSVLPSMHAEVERLVHDGLVFIENEDALGRCVRTKLEVADMHIALNTLYRVFSCTLADATNPDGGPAAIEACPKTSYCKDIIIK